MGYEAIIIVSWLAALTAGMLGIYALGFKIMRDVNDKVDKHVQDTKIHTDIEHPVVTSAVCQEVQKRNEVHFDNLANGQIRMQKSLDILVKKAVAG